MLFNSLPFLYVFLPVTYFVFWKLKTKQPRYIWLTVASYVFYGYWNYKFCFLMAFSTAVSYFAGLGILRAQTPQQRKACVVIPITIDLLLLAFFKYSGFAFRSIEAVTAKSPWPIHLPVWEIVLPIGISFYTFHTISYIVDAYRGTIKPTRNFWEFACYVSLFCQLVAGPIVRFRQIEGDLESIDHQQRDEWLNMGWSFFAIGLIKKVVLADTIAAVINPGFQHLPDLSSLSAWLCVLGYTYQLYFDFSGYSDMAVGLGYLFGLRLPQNFNSPYKATNIQDFWRRWHISLSSCLRDYLYIPLGGNRGTTFDTARNVIITMLLGGLWHGASWNFVLWGAYHSLGLTVWKVEGAAISRTSTALRCAATFVFVSLGWVLFRTNDLHQAKLLYVRMFQFQGGTSLVGTATLIGLLFIAGYIAHFRTNTFELDYRWSSQGAFLVVAGVVVSFILMYGAQQSPFLYFQF